MHEQSQPEHVKDILARMIPSFEKKREVAVVKSKLEKFVKIITKAGEKTGKRK